MVFGFSVFLSFSFFFGNLDHSSCILLSTFERGGFPFRVLFLFIFFFFVGMIEILHLAVLSDRGFEG